MKRIIFGLAIYLIGTLLISCSSSEGQTANNLVLKISYIDTGCPNSFSQTYSLLNINSLNEFVIYSDSSSRVLYNITKNGGFYISEKISDIHTLGCCELENIEKAIEMNINDNLSIDIHLFISPSTKTYSYLCNLKIV